MDFYGLDKSKVIGNHDGIVVGRSGKATRGVSSWNRIQPEHVLDILDKASPEVMGEARNLAQLLGTFSWRIRDAAGAQGGGNRIVSNVREITVSAAGRNFQLHCTETPALKLERITF